jgi:protein O-mannosyl-transferase
MLLAAATLLAYEPILQSEFITYDDGSYITQNPPVLSGINGTSMAWAFTAFHSGNWHPVTWISHMVDCQLFGVNPAGHHLMNLLLHIANSLLLFLVFQRMTRAVWPSAFIAAVFALHPLHVQSVAWAAERKDVLSTLFWLLTIWAYVRYVERPEAKRYLLGLLCFALGLMSKPMLVTLPFVLLLMDYWPLGRIRPRALHTAEHAGKKSGREQRPKILSLASAVKEKLPFAALAAASSVVTFIAQRQGGAVAAVETLPFNLRVANALVSYVAYIGKTLWPSDLAFFYPHPGEHLPLWQAALAGFLLAGATFAAVRFARNRPSIAVGWLWYIGTLAPVIGIVQVGLQAMADRYMYVPMIGLSLILAWGPFDMKAISHSLLRIVAIILVAGMGASTFVQAGYWHDSATLYLHAIDVTEHNWVAHTNLAVVLAGQGNIDGAIAEYREALQIKPDYAEAQRHLAFHLANQGHTEEAIEHLNEALRIQPDPEAHNNLGGLLARQGKVGEAIHHYEEALKLDPTYVEAHFNLAFFLSREGHPKESLEHYSEAVRIKPDYADARLNLGNLLIALARTDEGIAQYALLARYNPNYEKGQLAWGSQLAAQRKFAEAITHYNAALRINPSYREAYLQLGQAFSQLGDTSEAKAAFDKARQLQK